MPRMPRIHLPHALYYITCRAGQSQRLFEDDADYLAYLGLLHEYKQRHAFKLYAYALLPDHVHLCLQVPPEVTISTVMHDLTSRYTKHYNRRYTRSGHLFQARFRAVIAEKQPFLLALTGHIHAQPRGAGLVQDVAAYRWSSLQRYLAQPAGAEGPDMASEISESLQLLATQHPGTNRYQDYLPIFDREEASFAAQVQHRVLGSDAFVTAVRESGQGRETETPALGQLGSQRRAVQAHSRYAVMAAAMAGVCGLALAAISLTQLARPFQVLVMSQSPQDRDAQPDRPASMRVAPASLSAREDAQGLDGTEWDVRLIPMVASGSQDVQQGRLVFTDHRILSNLMTGGRFVQTQYQLSRSEDGTIIWEAIQTGAEGDIITWRGQRSGQTMRGVLERQRIGQDPEQWSFVGVSQQPPAGGSKEI